jgi:Holliday junction resolvase RusA-like endonuclease
MIKLTIPGEPIGKARARVTKWGTFTPEQTLSYESLLKAMYYEKHNGVFLEGNLRLICNAFFSIPASATKKKKELMEQNVIRPTKKPDWDNIGKIVTDALEKLAYKNDSQFVDATVMKWYTTEMPRVEIFIEEIGGQS